MTYIEYCLYSNDRNPRNLTKRQVRREGLKLNLRISHIKKAVRCLIKDVGYELELRGKPVIVT